MLFNNWITVDLVPVDPTPFELVINLLEYPTLFLGNEAVAEYLDNMEVTWLKREGLRPFIETNNLAGAAHIDDYDDYC